MAAATASLSVDDSDTCTLCTTKHNRIRPSVCQCKHCSVPLCLDCMKEHHDELLQGVAQISHDYNELQQFIQAKQNMIVDEITKSIKDVNQYFDTYIIELRQTQQKIIEDLETTKENAQTYILKINSDLHMLGIDVQALAKEGIVQTTKMKILSTELKKIEQQLNPYQVIRTENLIKTKPEYSIKFDNPSVTAEIPHSLDTVINKTSQIHTKEQPFKMDTLDMLDQPSTAQEHTISQPKENGVFKNEDESSYIVNNDNDNNVQDSYIPTSYHVDRMASDGENVLYTSYKDREHDLIVYCFIDDNNSVDICRAWKQSRILDMIWWNTIEKFICATKDAIYTVDYRNGTFKILCGIRDSWSYIRVAANADHLFIWSNNKYGFDGIEVYCIQFKCIKTIDFNNRPIGSFTGSSSSFCVTDNVIASICMRKQNNREVFQVTFCDLNMNRLYSILLGGCNDEIEIRTDGMDRFFISTGHRRFHIVRFNGEKETINLQYDFNCIAVLHNRRIAINNGNSTIGLVTY